MPSASLPKHAIPFAWHRTHQRMVKPEEVSKGLACDCICSACQSELVAKKGDERVWHFAHRVKRHCPSGVEAAVHRMAKQLIADRGAIFVPARVLTRTIHGPKRVWTENLTVDIQAQSLYQISECEIEQRIGGRHDATSYRRPDVLARLNGVPLAIEIKNTHAVDLDKEAWFNEHGISTLEIDVSDIVGDSPEAIIRVLEQRLFENDTHTVWLTHCGDNDGQKWLNEKERRVRAAKAQEDQALLAEYEREEQRRRNREAFRVKTRHIERKSIRLSPGSTLVIARSDFRCEVKVFGRAPEQTFERLRKLCLDQGGRFNSDFGRWEFVAEGATEPIFLRLCSLAETIAGQCLARSAGQAARSETTTEAKPVFFEDPTDQEAFEERAAILEFDAGLPRATAEQAACNEMLRP